jgi:hypothetical protein
MKVFLRALVNHFGNKHIKLITHSDLEKFQLERLTTMTARGSERSLTSVHRGLQLMGAAIPHQPSNPAGFQFAFFS